MSRPASGSSTPRGYPTGPNDPTRSTTGYEPNVGLAIQLAGEPTDQETEGQGMVLAPIAVRRPFLWMPQALGEGQMAVHPLTPNSRNTEGATGSDARRPIGGILL